MTTTTKPPALCARCPDCGTHDVPLRNGAFTAHRRTVPTSRTMQVRTERCPGSLRAATPDAVAQWVAWATDNARNADVYCTRKLVEARAALDSAEAAYVKARADLAAITRIAAERAATKETT